MRNSQLSHPRKSHIRAKRGEEEVMMEWMAECHHDGQKPTTTCLFIVEQHSLMHKGVSVYIWLCGIIHPFFFAYIAG